MAKLSKKEEQIIVNEIEMVEITFCCVGVTPLIMNRFQQKAWQELLMPSARKNMAERASTLKHDPIAEFRGAVYRNRDPKTPTLVHVPHGAFHGALASAALDIPGATKSKIERLTSIVDVTVELFGVPHIFCAMVRNSDMNRTPDVRTRPIFPEWACRVTIRYVKSLLTERTIANLFGAGGVIVGIGDWRPQKGGPYGTWKCVAENDPTFRRIVAKQGRVAQTAALMSPIFFDHDTEELLTWFENEVRLREQEGLLGNTETRTKMKEPRVPVMETRGGNVTTEGHVFGETLVKGNGRTGM